MGRYGAICAGATIPQREPVVEYSPGFGRESSDDREGFVTIPAGHAHEGGQPVPFRHSRGAGTSGGRAHDDERLEDP